MEIINLPAKEDTPSVILDAQNGKYEIAGKSMPENVAAFYQPIMDWLDEYAENETGEIVFDFKLVYFNTASSKLLLDIMMKLEEMHENGISIKIRWHYDADDDDMQEAGEEYSDIIEVPVELIEE